MGRQGDKTKKKKVTDGTTIINTQYMYGFQYKENVLDFFPTTEGYVKYVSGQLSDVYRYIFNFTDHLGNIRLKYSENPSTEEVTILEENHYYPYGLTHIGYNSNHMVFGEDAGGNISLTPVTPLLGDSYKYKFGGKEYQDEFDVNTYDFGARNYDPALGRWMNVDPLAEYMWSKSPYNYAYDNPIYYIDPDGMSPIPMAVTSLGMGIDGVKDIGGGSGGGDFGGGTEPDPQYPNTSGVQELDEVVVVAKKKDKKGSGIGSWGFGTQDNERRGDVEGELNVYDLPTGGLQKSGNLFFDLVKSYFKKISDWMKIGKKMHELDPNESTMETNNEEPVETPEEKANIKLKKVYPHFNRLNGKTNDLVTTKPYDTLVDKSDIPRIFRVKDSINKSKIDKAREKFNQRYEKK